MSRALTNHTQKSGEWEERRGKTGWNIFVWKTTYGRIIGKGGGGGGHLKKYLCFRDPEIWQNERGEESLEVNHRMSHVDCQKYLHCTTNISYFGRIIKHISSRMTKSWYIRARTFEFSKVTKNCRWILFLLIKDRRTINDKIKPHCGQTTRICCMNSLSSRKRKEGNYTGDEDFLYKRHIWYHLSFVHIYRR